MDKSKCIGCEDDFYNGKNDLGVKECFRLSTAKVISLKQVSVSQVPPWTQKPGKFPSCYRVRGYVFVDPKRMG